jgi:hypothetical protein
VYVYSSGTFTMSGGAISGNTASASGGGVYVSSSSGTFTKQDGTIYGSNASEDLKNTASNGAGHAVYAGSAKRRNSTADAGVNLDSSVSGGAGGWEMGSVQISLQAATSDPQLSNASLSVNESSSFSVGSGYSSYTWYWDGAVIAGATSYSYNMGAYSKTPGIYELSVVAITSTGEMLSARCRVVVKAK